MKTRVTAVTLLSLLLGGCIDTLFESQPGQAEACDTQFVGKWRVLPTNDKNSQDELFVIVDPQCKRWHFIDDGKEDEKLGKTVHIGFATIAGKHLLTVKVDPEKQDSNDPEAKWRDGYYYLRYEFADKSIHLRGVDDQRIAHFIIDGAVQGRTERVSREPGAASWRDGELHNFVAGKPEEMARVVQLEGVFADNDAYVLKPATNAEIFKKAKKPAKP